MLLALVHVATRLHAPLNEPQGRAQRAISSQGFHQGVGAIAHHLGEFDQTALSVLPGKEHDQPVLQYHPNQLGIQFTHRSPGMGSAPFIHMGILLPELVKQFHLPAFARASPGRLERAAAWQAHRSPGSSSPPSARSPPRSLAVVAWHQRADPAAVCPQSPWARAASTAAWALAPGLRPGPASLSSAPPVGAARARA